MRVLVVGGLHPEGLALLRTRCEVTETRSPAPAQLAQAEVLVVRSAFQVDQALLERMPVLKAVGRPGSGLDQVDLEACRKRGVAVLSTPEAVAPAVAELVLGFLLQLSCRPPRVELAGRTLGLLGFGHVGREVASRAAAFGMRLLAHDPGVADAELKTRGVEPVSFEALLERSDALSLHVPLTPGTRNRMDAAALARMKPGSWLINCARGGIVDEAALAAALKAGRPAAAALDVLAQEPPPPGHPLLDLPHVLITSHIGAATPEAQARAGRLLASRILTMMPRA